MINSKLYMENGIYLLTTTLFGTEVATLVFVLVREYPELMVVFVFERWNIELPAWYSLPLWDSE